MTIADTIDNILEIATVPEADRDGLSSIMLVSATMIAMRAAPAPDGFTVGETEEDIRKSSEMAAEILENDAHARAAVADYFASAMESIGSVLSETQRTKIAALVQEFREV